MAESYRSLLAALQSKQGKPRGVTGSLCAHRTQRFVGDVLTASQRARPYADSNAGTKRKHKREARARSKRSRRDPPGDSNALDSKEDGISDAVETPAGVVSDAVDKDVGIGSADGASAPAKANADVAGDPESDFEVSESEFSDGAEQGSEDFDQDDIFYSRYMPYLTPSGDAGANDAPPPPRPRPHAQLVLKEADAKQFNATTNAPKASLPKQRNGLEAYKVHGDLVKTWRNIRGLPDDDAVTPLTDRTQQLLFPYLNAYMDVWFAGRRLSNCRQLRNLTLLHILNHTLKTLDIVSRNNRRVKRADARRAMAEREAADRVAMQLKAKGRTSAKRLRREKKRASAEAARGVPVPECKDQGFTRPRVLIMAPMRNAAYKIVNALLRMLPESRRKNIHNKKRFEEEYGPDADERVDSRKGPEWAEAFKGNKDDHFKFGIAFSRTAVKIYADFYKADIIVASPLGLRAITGPLEAAGSRSSKFDFLSAIEICCLYQTDVFGMQNWEHVKVVAGFLNRKPFEMREGIDFSRVRAFNLDDSAKPRRQTIVLSAYKNVEMLALCNRACANRAGAVRVWPVHAEGCMRRVVPTLRQIFQRVDCEGFKQSHDAKFEYFREVILPKVNAGPAADGHTAIFIPSYLDFVRVRNHLKSKRYGFVNCCEYTRDNEIGRSRHLFFHGDTRYLLFTERFHFYRRYRIRGIQNIVLYGLPENPGFYTEILNMVEPGENVVVALYTKYDAMVLARTVGADRAHRMITTRDRSAFMFVSNPGKA